MRAGEGLRASHWLRAGAGGKLDAKQPMGRGGVPPAEEEGGGGAPPTPTIPLPIVSIPIVSIILTP